MKGIGIMKDKKSKKKSYDIPKFDLKILEEDDTFIEELFESPYMSKKNDRKQIKIEDFDLINDDF